MSQTTKNPTYQELKDMIEQLEAFAFSVIDDDSLGDMMVYMDKKNIPYRKQGLDEIGNNQVIRNTFRYAIFTEQKALLQSSVRAFEVHLMGYVRQ